MENWEKLEKAYNQDCEEFYVGAEVLIKAHQLNFDRKAGDYKAEAIELKGTVERIDYDNITVKYYIPKHSLDGGMIEKLQVFPKEHLKLVRPK